MCVSVKIHEAKSATTTRKNRLIHYYSWKLQHHSLGNGQTQQAENQLRAEMKRRAPSINWNLLISVDYFVQQEQNTHSSCKMFSKIDQILGHKTNLSKFKRIKRIINYALRPQWD